MPKRYQEDVDSDRYRSRPRRTYQQEGDSYSSYGQARGYRGQRGDEVERREGSSRRPHDEDDRHWRPSRQFAERDYGRRDSGSGSYRTTRSYHSTPTRRDRSPDRPSTRRYTPRDAPRKLDNGGKRATGPTLSTSHDQQPPREPAADRITQSRPPFLAPTMPPREPAKDRMMRNLPSLPADERRAKPSSLPRHKPKSPPREPAAQRAPPSHGLSKDQQPSSVYLNDTLKPSVTLSQPTDLRKLLILDLNGTLVLRSPYKSPPRGSTSHNPYANPYAPRPLRIVLPRPFLPSFREYLFHPKTREWLDTMVWSSAQPHSVEDMVHRAFCDHDLPDAKNKDELVSSGKLVAVWARDTLGLASDAYFQKTQTTKNLETPWKHFQGPEGAQHSPSSTLLLDDSPLKARLQPWNHLCVKEYTTEMRLEDLQVVSGDSTSHDINDYVDLDLTLLAVIGALDAIKWESNVAGWIRNDGLSLKGAGGAEPSSVPNSHSHSQSRSASPVAGPPSSSPPSSPPPIPTKHTVEERVAGGMWFEESSNLIAWARRGLDALKELGLDVVTGVVPVEGEEKRKKLRKKDRKAKSDVLAA